MKFKLILTLAAAGFSAAIFAQSGRVTDVNGTAIADVLVDAGNGRQLYSDSAGAFVLHEISDKIFTLQFSRLGYFPKKLNIKAADFPITVMLIENPLESGEVIISGSSARPIAPITALTFTNPKVDLNYQSQDLPMLLQNTPAVNAFSDAGSMAGYSYFRMRGMEQTRINFSINGVPVNDPENQGFFTHNFSDILSSASEIQVQRGAGISASGTSSLAGGIHLRTTQPADTFSAALTLAAGSYGTQRKTIELHSGRFGKGFRAFARLSEVESQGFRDNSATHALGYHAGIVKQSEKSTTELNLWGGSTRNQLSYLGLLRDDFENRPQTNYLTPEETDRFQQHFLQMSHRRKAGKYGEINISAYAVRGVGPEFKVRFGEVPLSWLNMPDVNDSLTTIDAMGSYMLDQWLAGVMGYYFYRKGNWELQTGLHLNYFNALHSMETVMADTFPAGFGPGATAHRNRGLKDEQSVFSKLSYRLHGQWLFFADLQLRRAAWRYRADDQPIARDTFAVEDMQWLFFNPRLGVRKQFNEKISLYLALAKTSREPTRFDYLQDDRANFNVQQSELKPESLYNLELGIHWNSRKLMLDANVFLMQFSNQLVNSGQLNTFGYPIMSNVGQSSRFGAEAACKYLISERLSLSGNAAFIESRISELAVTYVQPDFSTFETTYRRTPTALTPRWIVNAALELRPVKNLEMGINHRFVSAQYLDNTGNRNLMAESFQLLDLRANYRIKALRKANVEIFAWLNNLLDARYAPSGNTNGHLADGSGSISTSAFLFPAMGRNFMSGLRLGF